jgi:hypothetical protein
MSASAPASASVEAPVNSAFMPTLLKTIKGREMVNQVLAVCWTFVTCLGVAQDTVTNGVSAILSSWGKEVGVYFAADSAASATSSDSEHKSADNGSDPEYEPYDYGFGSSYGFGSFMKTVFHPAPSPEWLPKLTRDADWLVGKCDLKTTLPKSLKSPVDVTQMFSFLDDAMKAVGASSVKGYVLTSNKEAEALALKNHTFLSSHHKKCAKEAPKSRKTCRADFELKKHNEYVMDGGRLTYHPDYLRALRFVSKFAGRVHLWFEPWMTAHAQQMAKSGILTHVIDREVQDWPSFEKSHPATAVFLALAVSEFSSRKEFTLESQKQGALNKHLDGLLDLVIAHEPDGLELIAYLLPFPEIFRKVSHETCKKIYDNWMSWAPLLGRFLDDQWSAGVAKSARRQMRVLPRGSGVNSAGYNAVADAWQNMCRTVRLAVVTAEINGAPMLLKVLQLIANDQFQWGQAAGKGVHSSTAVYDKLTRAGFLPWNAVLRPKEFNSDDAVRCVMQACDELKCSPDAWLGLPGKREEETKVHIDMICGCAVPKMSTECADWLKALGLFGARNWAGN